MTDQEMTELDRLLATRVMGWHLTGVNWYTDENQWTGYSTQYLHTCEHSIWQPTRDIAQAMMVAEKIGLHIELTRYESGKWTCCISKLNWPPDQYKSGSSDTPALAISLAARAWPKEIK